MSRKFCNAVNCHWKNLGLEKFEGRFWCGVGSSLLDCDYIDNHGNIHKEPIGTETKIEDIKSLKTLAAYFKFIKQ